MNKAFIQGPHKELFIYFCSMTTLVMPQILESWKLCHNMLCGQQMSYVVDWNLVWAINL